MYESQTTKETTIITIEPYGTEVNLHDAYPQMFAVPAVTLLVLDCKNECNFLRQKQDLKQILSGDTHEKVTEIRTKIMSHPAE